MESAPHLYQDFWDRFLAFCRDRGTTLRLPHGSRRKYLPIGVGRKGFAASLDTNRKLSLVECVLWIDGRTAQEAFSQLRLREDQIKQELGKGIFFEKSPGGRAFKILEKKPCKLAIRNEWGAAHEWLKERGEAYVAVFAPIVRRLKLD